MKQRSCTTLAALVSALLATLVVAGPAEAAPARSWIVTLQDGANVDAVAGVAGTRAARRFTNALTAFSATLTDAQVARLEADGRVRSVVENTVVARLEEPDRTRQQAPSTQVVPEGVRRIGGLASPTARIDGVDRAVDADIAVLDGGIGPHEDLNVAAATDCVGDGGTADLDGHGTEVAGVAAAIDNRLGVVGVAPGARLWNVRIFAPDGTLSLESFLCGLDYVRRNADRIDTAVMSFGIDGTADAVCGVTRRSGRERGRVKYQVVDPADLAICRATAAGVLFVAAAGNSHVDAVNTLPAAYPEVLAVSAFTDTDGRPGGLGPIAGCFPTEADDTFASYSSFGRVVDLSAPGTCVVTTFPGNLYTVDVGTSFAAPHVAGAAALIKARNPRAGALAVAAQLQAAKERRPLPGDTDGFAEGVVNVSRF